MMRTALANAGLLVSAEKPGVVYIVTEDDGPYWKAAERVSRYLKVSNQNDGLDRPEGAPEWPTVGMSFGSAELRKDDLRTLCRRPGEIQFASLSGRSAAKYVESHQGTTVTQLNTSSPC
jgi:hypothetical protein